MKKRCMAGFFLMLFFFVFPLRLNAKTITEKDVDFGDDIVVEDLTDNLDNSENESVYGAKYIGTENESVHESREDGKVYGQNKVLFDGVAKSASSIPERYNSIEEKKRPKVSDQGIFGTCWAFSACNVISFDMLNDDSFNYENLNISQLQMAYFEYNRQSDPLDLTKNDSNAIIGNYLNDGGNPIFNALVLASWQGIYSEEKDPKNYNEIKSVNDEELNILSSYDANDTLAHLQNSEWYSIEDTNEIKKYIMEYGATSVFMDVANNKKNYYNPDTNAYYADYTISQGPHIVTVVGWDDNFSASNFKEGRQPKSDGAWIILNSWGKNTTMADENGCFYLSYSDKMLRKYNTAVTYDVEPADNYDYNYQYDGTMDFSKSYTSLSGNLKAANIYQAMGDSYTEDIEAVGVATYSTNTKVTVNIYKNILSDENPESGALVSSATTSETFFAKGFHTIKLNHPVNVKHGEKYSVVITLSKSGYEDNSVSLLASKSIKSTWYYTYNETSNNQSFLYNNKEYVDLNDNETVSFRIKAYTKKSNTTYDYEPVFYWSDDGKTATLDLICNQDLEYSIYNMNAKVKVLSKEAAGCRTSGYIKYQAYVKLYDNEYSQEKSIEIPPTGHNYKTVITKADTKKDGCIKEVCSACGDVKKTTTIKKIATVTLKNTTFVYNNKAKKPAVTIKDSKKKTISSKYYTISYKSNIKVGTGSVTIKFKTYYSGSVTKTFKIIPKSTTIKTLKSLKKAFKLEVNKQTNIKGYQFVYSTDKNFSKNKKYVTLSNSKTISKTISKLKSKRTYYVKVRCYKVVNNKRYYSNYSAVKRVKVG
ncbi:Cysteine protease, C1A family [Acetitomaculum ruminis DSM 5522]|uniref:Cysteine protease, C1A family n=1 Tax=Acetitomaculum ruminis DSM 5522 TaxID=1120918 RepID=A0A1I0YSI4_9FIRM|nr:lectin like domain-containing protein [Acetitomaculum ruminis]SFB16345.1 Cysteine protease, C1A family [Acetitomaculum ruminis DSM 5522]